MILDVLTVGKMEENCYLTGAAEALLVIDPGDEGEKILSHIQKHGYRVKYVVLTHCHYDHIGAVEAVMQATGASLLLGAREKENYEDRHVTLRGYFTPACPLCPPDRLLFEGDEILSGPYRFRVLETPGHTSGSLCLLCGDTLFSGDTLFYQSVGRADFPTGNLQALTDSVLHKLFALPDSVRVCPGHGPQTTIGAEKEQNEIYEWA